MELRELSRQKLYEQFLRLTDNYLKASKGIYSLYSMDPLYHQAKIELDNVLIELEQRRTEGKV
ncbi:MAG TPA: hypothetical protein VM101_11320 [Flavitalea sp.]|nr:hypothetical protein [Flavitalea sp.]